MSSEQDLHDFVREAVAAGADRGEIATTLTEAGWSPAQIREEMDRFTGSTLSGVAVPRPRPSSKARDFFVYGALFTSLFVTAINVGGILFGLIDVLLGIVDSSIAQAIRSPLSIAIVSTPVFLLLDRLVHRDMIEDPNRRMSDIRRGLTYATLFVSGLVILGVVSGLIYSVLGGELTASFGLKSLVVGGIAGIGFTHYLRDMQVERSVPPTGGSQTPRSDDQPPQR